VELKWVASKSTSALHAADALRRGRTLTDNRLAPAIRGPATRLADEIRQAGLPEQRFWDHLVPLSEKIGYSRDLVQVALRKTVGPAASQSEALLIPLTGVVAEVEQAMRTAGVSLDDVARRAVPLREAWNARGRPLLAGVAARTDAQVLAPAATVILIYPATGGGGAAHLAYNSVRIEPVALGEANTQTEILRLAWLLIQLQGELPMFSEQIPAEHLLPVVQAAMLSPLLEAAAEQNETFVFDRDRLSSAVTAWIPEMAETREQIEPIWTWWQTYTGARPPWNVGLAALDAMLFGAASPA